jgi:hypothetical protein
VLGRTDGANLCKGLITFVSRRSCIIIDQGPVAGISFAERRDMRSHRMLWLAAALVAGLFHSAFACDDDTKRIEHPTNGEARAEDQTVLLSVVITNHGLVRDAKVVSGPATLQQSALELVNRKKYRGKPIEQWGTAPAGPSARQLMLAVTFTKQKGMPPKIEQVMPAGVSGCVYATRVRVSPNVMA